jgi:hypothetical protein
MRRGGWTVMWKSFYSFTVSCGAIPVACVPVFLSLTVSILLIVPLLASLDPVTFCSLHLKEIVERLLALLKGDEWLALLAIAHLATIYRKPIVCCPMRFVFYFFFLIS